MRFKLTVDRAGVGLFWLRTGRHVRITDVNGNKIKHIEYARLPELNMSFIIAQFPAAGTYYADEVDTDEQDPSFAIRYETWESIPGDVEPFNSAYVDNKKLFIPVKTLFPERLGHTQGLDIYNGKLYVSITDRVVELDPWTGEWGETVLTIDDIKSNDSQNHIGDIFIDENGIMWIPLEYWDGSTGSYKELVKYSIPERRVIERIDMESIGSDISSVFVDGEYVYVTDYVNAKLRKLTISNGSVTVVEEIDTPAKPQGVAVIDGVIIVSAEDDANGSLFAYIDGSWVPLVVKRPSSGVAIEGVAVKGGTFAWVTECLGSDNKLFIVLGQVGHVLRIEQYTAGANQGALIPLDDIDVMVITSTIHAAGRYDAANGKTNTSPGVGWFDDAGNGVKIGFDTDRPRFDIQQFDNGSYSGLADDEFTGLYGTDTGYINYATVFVAKKNGSAYKGYVVGRDTIEATSSKGGSAAGIVLRIWRYFNVFGPVVVLPYQDLDPTVTIEEIYGAFSITDCPSSVNVQAGQKFTISVKVKNGGTAPGASAVRLVDHSGNIVDAVDVTLGAGEEVSVSLTATAPSLTGTYTWRVEVYNVDAGRVDDSKNLTVEVVGAVPIPMDTFWYLLIAVVLIAMLLLLIALALRRS